VSFSLILCKFSVLISQKMFSLLNILGTIDKPTKGSLEICGVHVANKTTDRVLADLRLHHIGFVFQTFNLLPSLTAVENVEVSLLLLRNCLSYFYFFIIFKIFFNHNCCKLPHNDENCSYQWFSQPNSVPQNVEIVPMNYSNALVYHTASIMYLHNFQEENNK
jgi:ABC-type sugar transport system ATPase subunit